MTEELRFTTDAGLIDRLGRELVGRQETALIELVKNSFDADAMQVTVFLERDALVIEDNGTGMTRDELVAGFLRLASTFKVGEPRSRIYRRPRAGRKGIGRFSSQRLGKLLRLRTWTNDDELGLELVVDWRRFENGRSLEEIPVHLGSEPAAKRGTILRIEGLRDNWSDAQVRRCWRGLLALQQPFPVLPVENRPNKDPGFRVQFLRNGALFDDPALVVDFQSEILSHMHAMIEFRVDNVGVAEWRISQNRFGPDRGWARINHRHRDGKPPPYTTLHDVAMKAHYFVLLPDLLPNIVFSRIRDVLRDEGGIRLYRNGFRVVPYGEPNNDWLRLDQIYAQRGVTLAPIARRNFFGIIEVQDPEGRQFEEHTSREGLIETDAVRDLTDLTTAVLVTAVNCIQADRGRKTNAGGNAQRKTTDTLNRLRNVARVTREREDAERQRSRHPDGSRGLSISDAAGGAGSAAALIQESIELIEQQQIALADETTLLRLLATLGLTTSEFSHETGMTFEAVRMDFQSVFDVALVARAGDKEFATQAGRANAMLARLDALTAYLTEVASARSVRQLAPVSVAKAIGDFEVGVKRLAEKAGITLEIDIPAYDPLFTKPMHAAEIASILLNFFSNSLKALRRVEGARRIHIKAEREGDDQLVIHFSDTGDGIPEEHREKVFNLFFTTRIAAQATAMAAEQYSGTGLGLWIVHQIVSKVGGDIEVIDALDGFSTCLEVRLPAEEEA